MNATRPLSPADHAELRFDSTAAGAARQFVRIGLSELAFAAAEMPICLAKDAGSGRFNLIALMGLIEPANLFSHGGRFQATYVPRAALLTGFRLDPAGSAGLAIDPSDPTIGERGEALFSNGEPAPILDHLRGALQQLVADAGAAQGLVDAWAAQRLLRPLKIALHKADGASHHIAGLYTIDEEMVRALADEDVVRLHRADALAPLAIVTASLAQIERLKQLHNARYTNAITEYALG